MNPINPFEPLLAVFRPSPPHDPLPAPRRPPRGAAKALLAAGAVPIARLARLGLRLGGRSRPLDPARLGSIAFVKLDHLGDVLMTTPLLRAVKAWAPLATLTVYCRPASAEVLLRLPYVDAVELADVPWIRSETGMRANAAACLDLAAAMRSRRYDLAIDLRYHNRLDSLLLSLCGARARLGFDAGGFGFGITHAAPWPQGGHEADRGAAALRRFGIPVDDLATEFPVSAAELATAARRTGRGRPYVALHVGAGNAIKRWMPDRWAWVARELARRTRLRVAVLSGPGDEAALGAPVVRALPRANAIDLRGQLRLPELAAVIKGAVLFLGNDGGAGHVAAAVGTPAVIVFSGTSLAAEWAPRGSRLAVVEKWVSCKPCHSTTCPFNVECLRAATVDEVLAASMNVLGQGGRPALLRVPPQAGRSAGLARAQEMLPESRRR